MSLQFPVATRNSRLEAINTEVGGTATLEIRSGAAPADCAAADSGTLLATVTLPATPFAAAASGAMAMSGAWSTTGSAAGTAGHFRIKAGGTTTKIQGTCGQGSGDMSLDNTNIANGQAVNVNSFTITDGNA